MNLTAESDLFSRVNPAGRGEAHAPTGKELKEEGMATVLENAGEDWKTQALQVVLSMPRGVPFLAEDVRLRCEKQGITPHHNNAWGGFFNGLRRKEVVVHTGRYVPTESPKTHAHVVAEYVLP